MRRRSACCLVLILLLAACSTPPDKERQQAETALDAARAAGAATYAAVAFEDAQAALKQYDAAVAQRDYRQALSHALEARDLAYAAVKQVETRKTELRNQADRLAADLDALITRATTRLAPAGRMAGPGAARLRTARDAGRVALQEARTHLAQLDYQRAVRALEPAVSRLRREMPAQDAPAQKKKK
jgi:hypothetical protein